MKKSILVLGLSLVMAVSYAPHFLNAQDLNPLNSIIPPNPDAASLAKYADFPVNLSSGVPQIDIPLWNIKCGDIHIPVSLSYHASGISVAAAPSYVGLGWTLNAGGVITRTIRGIADDGMFQFGYGTPTEALGMLSLPTYAINLNSAVDNLNPSKYRAAAVGKADLEPDMFYYNFCNLSGKFVFDFNGTPHLIPRKNIVIEKVRHSPPGHTRIIKWKVTTEDGVKYYFDEVEATEQETKTDVTLQSGAPVNGQLATVEYNSAWFLTKVKLPNGSDSVVFQYDEIVSENRNPVSEIYKKINYAHGIEISWGADFWQVVENLEYARKYYAVDAYEETQSTSTITGRRLSKIVAPDQTVEFIPGAYRHDIKGDRVLDEVVVKDNANEIIKRFKLSYNYFSSNGMLALGSANPAVDPIRTDLRLSLKSVQELSQAGQNVPPYTFAYENSVWLPDRVTSKAQDHWGYYNGADANTSLLPYLNAIRDASTNAMKAGSLVKITYPTGGDTQFTYEANSIFHNNAIMTVGGLRIKEKKDYDPVSGKRLFKQYDYHSSGYVGGLNFAPIYNYVTHASGFTGSVWWDKGDTNYTSTSNSQLNNGGEWIVSYENVTVIEGNDQIGINGKTENYFTILPSVHSPAVTSPTPTEKVNAILGGSGQTFPFAPAISGAWGCGLLKSQSTYKYTSNGYSKIKEIQNTYKNDYWGATNSYNAQTDVLAAKVGIYSTIDSDEYGIGQAYVQFYYIPSRNINLVKTIEIDFDDAENPTASKVTETEYDNTSPYIYPSKTTYTLSDGNKLVEQILYPKDYTNAGSDFVGLMKTNYMIGKPIEKITYKIEGSTTSIRSGELFTYKIGSHLGKPDKIFKLQIEAPIAKADFKLSSKTTTNALAYNEGTNGSFSLAGIDPRYTSEPEIIYDSYDDYGNPTQVTTRSGITSFIWAYDHQYPVAKIENATYAEIRSFLEGSYVGYEPAWYVLMTGSFISGYSGVTPVYTKLDDSGYRYRLNLIRDQFPGARVTTYTYKPLVGMTSQTDFNGKTMYYEYDTIGRLKYIRDHDNSILNSYEYNYQRP